MVKTLKQDIQLLRCYLRGHKPKQILTAVFPFGISIITNCARCKRTLAWNKMIDMTPDEASELINLILEEKIEFLNKKSDMSSFQALNIIRERLSQLMKDQNF